jgi:DNA-binding NtrC family response regulator
MGQKTGLKNVLIIDDDEDFCRLLSKMVSAEKYQGAWTTQASAVGDLLTRLKPVSVFLDLKLAGLDGMVLLKRIKKFDKQLPVIILTGFESIETAVQAIQQGAFYYMSKMALKRKELGKIIAKAERSYRMHQKIPTLKKKLDEVETLEDFLGFSEKIQQIVRLEVSPSPSGDGEALSAPQNSSQYSLSLPSDLTLKEAVRLTTQHIEKKWILNTLIRSQWRQGRAARLLGIDTKTLYNKMKTYRIERE